MANEINVFQSSGNTLYSVIREVDGDVWYVVGKTFEVWGTGGRTAADYDIALTDKSGGMYVGNFDANIPAGFYYVVAHQQSGGAPANTDRSVWQEYGYWDGTNWKSEIELEMEILEEINPYSNAVNWENVYI